MTPTTPTRTPKVWGVNSPEILTAEERDVAIEEYLDGFSDRVFPPTLVVEGFAPRELTAREPDPRRLLADLLDQLDEEYGDPDGDGDSSKPTPAMVAAAEELAAVIRREYQPCLCEAVCREVVDVRSWLAEHRPDWLTEATAP